MPQVHVIQRRPGYRHRRGVNSGPLQFGQHDRDGGRAVVTARGYVAARDQDVPYPRQAPQHVPDQARLGVGGELHMHDVAAQFETRLEEDAYRVNIVVPLWPG